MWLLRARQALKTLLVVPRVIPGQIQPTSEAELLSVVIPAKNEEKNIGPCLDSLLAQKYCRLQIIVANDSSDDQTEAILKSYGDQIEYVNVPSTPKGWTGKTHAIDHAVKQAKGHWLLFTDADTRHAPNGVAAALEHAKSRDLDFLTLLPRCITHSLAEDTIQPTAMALLGLWFPLDKANNPRSSVYFGNGQFILMNKKLYEATGGHRDKHIRGEYLEDFALMKKTKELNKRAECAFGPEVYGTQMYDSFKRIWQGWRRIYLHAFKQNPWKLARHAFLTLIFSVVPFAGWLVLMDSYLHTRKVTDPFLLGFLGAILIFIWIIAWRSYAMVKAKTWYALAHPIAATIVAMILLDASFMAAQKTETKWR